MFYDPKNTDGVLIVANGDWSGAHGASPEADRLLADLMSEPRRPYTQN
jgi:hypothetical protein